LDSKEALEQLLPKGLMQKLERHHVYSSQTAHTSLTSSASALQSSKLHCNMPVKIGLLDTAIDLQHPAFKQQKIKAQNFVVEGAVTPKNHATAVAGVLIGNHEQLRPRLSKAELYSAEVFYARNEYSQGAALDALLQGLNWLAEQKAPVINMSLTGPHNDILELAIKQLSKQKIALVAAAGNNGPAAPAAYPAAYEEVIAVTAVDEKGEIYRWANQGDYIDFAAHGVSVLTTQSPDKVGYESGTSLAAPVVAAAIGCGISEGKLVSDIVIQLKKVANDLGAKGKDPVFGYGWLGY
jgi:subtilisin family serine protease